MRNEVENLDWTQPVESSEVVQPHSYSYKKVVALIRKILKLSQYKVSLLEKFFLFLISFGAMRIKANMTRNPTGE